MNRMTLALATALGVVGAVQGGAAQAPRPVQGRVPLYQPPTGATAVTDPGGVLVSRSAAAGSAGARVPFVVAVP